MRSLPKFLRRERKKFFKNDFLDEYEREIYSVDSTLIEEYDEDAIKGDLDAWGIPAIFLRGLAASL